MKLKTVKIGEGEYAEQRGGKPLYVADDGTEVEGDLPGTIAKFKQARDAQQAAETALAAANTSLEPWKGKDPAKVAEALTLAANLDAKKLIDAGEVERLKKEIAAGYDGKILEITSDRDKRVADAESRLARQMRLAELGRSQFREKLAEAIRPVDILETLFGHYFVPEGDRLVAMVNGQKLGSKKNPIEPAGVDEALEIIIGSRPDKDALLAPVGANGGGARPTTAVSAQTYVLSEAEAKDPIRYRAAKEAAAKAGQTLQIGS